MIRNSWPALALFTIILSTAASPAQERETVSQSTLWFSASSTVSVNKRLSILAEGHFRTVGSFEPMQLQLRTGADTNLGKHWSVMPIGYVYTWNPIYGRQPNEFVNNEHRLFEQLVFKHTISKAKLSHRLRIEQRYLQTHSRQGGEVVDHGYNTFANRFRYRLSTQIPVATRDDGSESLSVLIYDELFMSFGQSVHYERPDQNRIFAGIVRHFTKELSLQAGAFYQLLIKASGTKQENNIGVQVNLVHQMKRSRG